MTPEQHGRAVARPRIRRTAAIALAVSFGLLASFALGRATARGEAEPPLCAPAVVIVPAASAPSLAAPPAPPAEPAPEPAPEKTQREPPRATTPVLDAGCVAVEEPPVECSWDDGFPAISRDGTQVVAKHHPDDSGRGNPGLSIKFIDTRSSKIVRDVLVLSPDEYDVDKDGGRAMRAKIAARIVTVQRLIEAGEFRTMSSLGSSEDAAGVDDDPGAGASAADAPAEPADPDESSGRAGAPAVRAQFASDAVRIIDPASNVVVWQRRFPVTAAFPDLDDGSDHLDDCRPSRTRAVTAWWDDVSRTILAEVSYEHGSCMCASRELFHVFHARGPR